MKRALAAVLAAAVAAPPAWGRTVAPRAWTSAPVAPAVPAPFLIKPGMTAPSFSPNVSGPSLSAGLASQLPVAARPAQVLTPLPAATVRHISLAQRLVLHNAGARPFALRQITGMLHGAPQWGPGRIPVEPGREGAADFIVRTWEKGGVVTSLPEPFLRAAYVGLSGTDGFVGVQWAGEEFPHVVRFSLSSAWSDAPAPAGEHRLALASPENVTDGVPYAELAPVGGAERPADDKGRSARFRRRPVLGAALAPVSQASMSGAEPSPVPAPRAELAARGGVLAGRLALLGAAAAGILGALAHPLAHVTGWSAAAGLAAGGWALWRTAKLAAQGLGDTAREKAFALAVLAGTPLTAGTAAYFAMRELLGAVSFAFYGGAYPILGFTALPGLAFLALETARSRGVFKGWRPLAALSAAAAGLTALSAAGLAWFVGGWTGALGAAALAATTLAWRAFLSDAELARRLPDPKDRTTYMMLADASSWNALAVGAAASLASAGWAWAAAAFVPLSALALVMTALAVPDESARAAVRARKGGIL